MEKHKYFPFKITNGLEATSFTVGYAALAYMIGNMIFSNTKPSYLMFIAFAYLMVCLAKIYFRIPK